jgi:hypothetical protein
MLYPPDKAGFKRIGEEMADLIAQAFGVDRRSLDVPEQGSSPEPQVQLQWITAQEAALLSLFRATDAEGQDSVFKLAEVVPKVRILPRAIVNDQ